jgi:hypothetical protein
MDAGKKKKVRERQKRQQQGKGRKKTHIIVKRHHECKQNPQTLPLHNRYACNKEEANNEAPSNQRRAARAFNTFKPNLLMPLSNRRQLTPARGSPFLFV